MYSHPATSLQLNRTWLLQVGDNESAARDPEKIFFEIFYSSDLGDWELGSLSAVGSRFRTKERWQQSVGTRPAFGFASIFRFDHRD
jgi:hypothetical protein